jgi:aminopeptidase N
VSRPGRGARAVPSIVLLLAAAAAIAADTAPASWPQRSEVLRPYDVLHYRIEVDLDVSAKRLVGETTVSLISLAEAANSVTLDADTFDVFAVRDGDGRALSFEQGDGVLAIDLGRTVGYGERLELVVSYEAVDPTVDPAEHGLPPDYRLGLSFRDASGATPAIVSTLSWPTGAHHWYPCNDRPADRATQEVIATVPAVWSALSNGSLVAVTEHPERAERSFHWRLELSHPTYLSALAAGPYEVIPDDRGPVPVAYWAFPGDETVARRAFADTPEVLAFFSDLYRFPFPWPKYDQVMVPGITGGAESTSATLIGERRVRMARSDDYPMGWLVAHEAAHQWWGNVVTHRDWTHTWLSESFATYSEHLYLAHRLGADEATVDMLAKRSSYFDEARSRYQRPIVLARWRHPSDVFDRHSYQKGAAVLHMLRSLVGDDAFFAALSGLLHRNEFRPVDTHDFEMAVRGATGANLDWFFDQWLRRAGHPVLEVRSSWDERGGGRLLVAVTQVQDAEAGVPVFRLPVSVGITTHQRSWSESVWLTERQQSFELECPERPLLVRFDHDNVLLAEVSFPKSSTELRYQLRHGDVAGRMRAAGELAPQADEPGVIDALQQAATADPLWAVRRAAVQAIGELHRPELAGFLEGLDVDVDARVRAAALETVGEVGARGCLGYLERRFELDPSVLVRVAAVRAAARCGGPAAVALLDAAEASESPGDAVRRAAAEAREVLDDPDASNRR